MVSPGGSVKKAFHLVSDLLSPSAQMSPCEISVLKTKRGLGVVVGMNADNKVVVRSVVQGEYAPRGKWASLNKCLFWD